MVANGSPWLAWALAYGLPWGGALALTLVLAAWCTPRTWWRRPNLRALAVLAGSTLVFGPMFTSLLPAAPPVSPPVSPPASPHVSRPVARAASGAGPAPGTRYRVVDDLNLRAAHGVRAARTRVLPAGTIVSATGAADGDWWRVRARIDGRDVDGWASSLWLRRTDEGH